MPGDGLCEFRVLASGCTVSDLAISRNRWDPKIETQDGGILMQRTPKRDLECFGAPYLPSCTWTGRGGNLDVHFANNVKRSRREYHMVMVISSVCQLPMGRRA